MPQLYNKYRPYFIIAFLTIISTAILWMPFILKTDSLYGIDTKSISFQTVLQHWDGPLYIIPAKTLYDPQNETLANAPLGLETKYFAAHLPLYPLTIKALAPLVGFPKATAASTLLFSIFLFWFFYYFLNQLKLTNKPLLLTAVFMFITPRFFVVRSVGSPEPIFVLFILASLFYFIRKKYLLAGLTGALAIMTKTPAALLLVAYLGIILQDFMKDKKIDWRWLWLGLIPGGLLLVFAWYGRQYGDFLVYFHSGDNLHLLFPPFKVFNFQKNWVDTGWLEEVLFVYFFYGLTLVELWPESRMSSWITRIFSNLKEVFQRNQTRVNQVFFYFTLVFFISLISVQHRDIARYSIPLLPIALITFERFFTSKKFIIVLVFLLPAIYLYAWNFMLFNIAPITDWVPFL
ncbi:hypothetical protein A3F34_00735 [Candidatus Roizmanbacteria bacterium RIFCSPHIGHO2_12_FULL_44_10]|uniref:Glycosyltransferase RgtA/B/C/D-like domain-containing protein n=1 Tax=Candidatus Roizmanbacteria bacterium RIFCSPHIGHO2_12_FULL_44_10 TaxID=1802054 RepID=A0A1F7I6P4_9BACT|nr:MAG: hypothetical protein A3F34_00735 [Candidatus Roizmanbacteria bacterium RIFCSPHIGHO2_12_FULL_44_10]